MDLPQKYVYRSYHQFMDFMDRQLPVPLEKTPRKGTISNMAQSVVSPQGTVKKTGRKKGLEIFHIWILLNPLTAN